MTPPAALPITAPLDAYVHQADLLLAGFRAGDDQAVAIMRASLPRFLDPAVPWKPLDMPDAEVRATLLDADDARLALARAYSFADWRALETLVTAIADSASPESRFERAAEAVIDGDLETLTTMLRATPELAHARSTRATCHDPSVHRATLLHYVAANGVEGHRQRSPSNAVAIAELLLQSGAHVDALGGFYGGEYATLSMLVSSSPPALAGVQGALTACLLDHGASIEGAGSPQWHSPLRTALTFGFTDVAALLVARGARTDTLPIAAGCGLVDRCRVLLTDAAPAERHAALALAALNNRLDVVSLLLDAGESPDRYNPDGLHSHQTPLHGAALAGHLSLIQLLVSRGARLDLPDALWQSTPLGWARHGGQDAVVAWLEARGAPE